MSWQESDLSPELRKRIAKQEGIQTPTPIAKSAKKSKYGNVKTIIDNITFDSKKESNRYIELKARQQCGQIANLALQPEFQLQEPFIDSMGVRHRAITYKADFMYLDRGDVIVEDVKGKKTEVYRIKKKLLLKRYPDIIFREVY